MSTNFTFAEGTIQDLDKLKSLAVKSWSQYQSELTDENWTKLYDSLNDSKTYEELLAVAKCIICVTDSNQLAGMAFLVPSNNPTAIYDKDWCYIRFISVDPEFEGQGIGRSLTNECILIAKNNGEKKIALHTSELMIKARHIYESLGFTILREIDQRLGKRYWLYTLDLTQVD